MKHFLTALVLVLLVAGCAPRGVYRFSPVPHPAPATPAAPKVSAIKAPLAALDATTREMDSRVAVLQREATAARTEAQAATIRAKTLAEAGTATQEDLTRTWRDLQAAEARNLFLETETAALGDLARKRAVEATMLREVVSAAETAAAAKDAEAKNLALALDAANERGKSADEALQAQTARAEKAERKSAQAQVYRRWVIILAVSFSLLWLAREIIPRIIRGGI